MTEPETLRSGEIVGNIAPAATEPRISDLWLHAPGESWWVVTGSYVGGGKFTQCLAQVSPAYVTGVPDGEGEALFVVHVWGSQAFVPASLITAAKRLVFVAATDPTVAYYADEQTFITQETR